MFAEPVSAVRVTTEKCPMCSLKTVSQQEKKDVI